MVKTRERQQAGFNLIELMLVMAIIALLISVSGYAWQIMIRRCNEAAAVAYLNKINTAQAFYASRHKGRFADSFHDLVDSNLIGRYFDAEMPLVDGYHFTLVTENDRSNYFSINADPAVGGGIKATGTSHYFLDSSSHSITATDEDRKATAVDPSI